MQIWYRHFAAQILRCSHLILFILICLDASTINLFMRGACTDFFIFWENKVFSHYIDPLSTQSYYSILCCEIDSAITILQCTLWPRWHSWKSSRRRGKTFYGILSMGGLSITIFLCCYCYVLYAMGKLLLSILPSSQS